MAVPPGIQDKEPLFGHLLDCVPRPFLPGSRTFHSAIGHVVNPEGGDIVRHHSSHLGLLKGLHDTPQVPGEHAELHPVHAPVGPCQGIIKISVRGDRDDRGKDLLPLHPHIRSGPDQDGRHKHHP